jgi:hypothetical protein
VKRLEVIATVDSLEITDVVVNKGNCQIASTINGAIELSVNEMALSVANILADRPLVKVPQTINPKAGLPLRGVFGERLSIYVPLSCNILLVELVTSHGNWTTKFSP